MDDCHKILNNKYVLEKSIGKGAFGLVYKAHDIHKENKLYAVKLLDKKKINKSKYLKKALQKEVEIMDLLSHENSVKLIDYFENDENYHIVMELCDTDLDELLKFQYRKNNKGFNELQLWMILNQLNKIVQKMRENNIIHRDLKLKNIMVKKDQNVEIIGFIVKLSDFGFSKQLNDGDLTGTCLGSPATQAPEVKFEQKYNKKADLWSIGVMIYQLLFNNLPFTSTRKDDLTLELKYKWNSVSIPENTNNEISPKCFDLINRLLQKDPDKRIDFEDYFKHSFFSEEHKKKLIEKYNKIKEEKDEKEKDNNESENNNNIKKQEEKKPEIVEIVDFEKKYKKLIPIKEYNGYILYKGKDLKNNRNVYIKEISRSIIDNNERFTKLVQKEINLLSLLKGKNFPEFIGFSKTKTHYNIVMEYFSGKILYDFIKYNQKDLDKNFSNLIFTQLKPSLLEIKEKNIILDIITPNNFAFSFYQNENNFDIKFFDYVLHSIFLEEIYKKNKDNTSLNNLTFKLDELLKYNIEENNNLNIKENREPIIKDEQIENIFEIIKNKINFIYDYFDKLFDNKENVLENEIYLSYDKEIITFLYFAYLECQIIINFLKITADTYISDIDKTNQEIHFIKIYLNKVNNKDKKYDYSGINFIDESNNNAFFYNKENPSFEFYLNIFNELKNKIKYFFKKFKDIDTNNNLFTENNDNELENSSITLITKSELNKTGVNEVNRDINVSQKCLEQCLKEGNIDNLFLNIFGKTIFNYSFGKKDKIIDELNISKYLIEYILFLKAIFGNLNSNVYFGEILGNFNEQTEILINTFLGGKIKLFKEKETLNYNCNKDKKVSNEEFEKMINIYIKIIKLIEKLK